MKVTILTTEERHHIYYTNRLRREFAGYQFQIILENQTDFSSFKRAGEKFLRLLKKRDLKGLICYFPYFKINPFGTKQYNFEKSFLPDSEKFSILPEKVENHNSAASLVNQFGPDLVIVFGARPLNKNFLKQISFPIVNHHGAILPYMRGLDSDAWLCFYRKFEYLGCSIHFVTPELDQGGIIATKGLELKKDIRFWMLRGYKAIAHADLAIGVLKNFEESVGKATVNNVSLGIYRSYAPWHVFYSAERNLRSYLERGVR